MTVWGSCRYSGWCLRCRLLRRCSHLIKTRLSCSLNSRTWTISIIARQLAMSSVRFQDHQWEPNPYSLSKRVRLPTVPATSSRADTQTWTSSWLEPHTWDPKSRSPPKEDSFFWVPRHLSKFKSIQWVDQSSHFSSSITSISSWESITWLKLMTSKAWSPPSVMPRYWDRAN
jgi:hypothetical protein